MVPGTPLLTSTASPGSATRSTMERATRSSPQLAETVEGLDVFEEPDALPSLFLGVGGRGGARSVPWVHVVVQSILLGERQQVIVGAQIGKARHHVGLVGELEGDGRAGGARRGQHRGDVDDAAAQRLVAVAVAAAAVVVEVHVAQIGLRLRQPLGQRTRESGVARVEHEPQAAQVEVAGLCEVRVASDRHVLDRHLEAVGLLQAVQLVERAFQGGRHLGVPGPRPVVEVGVDDIEKGAELLRCDRHVAAMQVERGAVLGARGRGELGVGEGAVYAERQPDGRHGERVARLEQRVPAVREDLGGGRQRGDAQQGVGERALGERARRDADVGVVQHAVLQYMTREYAPRRTTHRLWAARATARRRPAAGRNEARS